MDDISLSFACLCTVPLKVIHIIPRYFGKISKFSVELYFWPQLLDSQMFFSFVYNKAIYRMAAIFPEFYKYFTPTGGSL
jgi:hypothetical protein